MQILYPQVFLGNDGDNLLLGWWGYISFVVTPFFLLNNLGRYVCCLTMPAVRPGATPPTLTEDALKRINPFSNELFDRLSNGEDYHSVVNSISEATGTTPGQVTLYIRAVVESRAS